MINFVLALAVVSLGFLVGWLTGASGRNETSGPFLQVVAAVIPVVITVSGLVLYYAALKFPEKLSRMAASSGIIVFRITIFFGLYRSTHTLSQAAIEDIGSVLKAKSLVLEDCSRQEFRINESRRELDLPDLPTLLRQHSIFCLYVCSSVIHPQRFRRLLQCHHNSFQHL